MRERITDLRDRRDAREGPCDLERALELRTELDVAAAQLVVGGIDAERLLEGFEGARQIAELVLLQDADAPEHASPARPAGVFELDAEVACALLGRLRACGERRCRAGGEALVFEETRRDPSRVGMRGVDLEEGLHVRHRALQLLQLVREDLDQLGADAPRVLHVGRGVGAEGLFQHSRDIAIAVRLQVPRLERVSQRLVARVDLDEVLVGLDRLFFEVRALVEHGRAFQEEALLLAGTVGRRVHAEIGELPAIADARELCVDPLEGAGMTGICAQSLLQVRRRPELVAQHLEEEERGAIVELCLDGREERPQLAALRDRLVGERELRDAACADRRVVQLLPDPRVERVLRVGDEQGVEDLLLVFELRLERRDARGGGGAAGWRARRRRLHWAKRGRGSRARARRAPKRDAQRTQISESQGCEILAGNKVCP
jgi:hypothetical protein